MIDLRSGDCIEVMRGIPDGSLDAVVTDPPYGINFMGKAWDGKAIEAAAARPRDLEGLTRLTGSHEAANRKQTQRTQSGYQNRAGEAGAYDFSVGRFGDERDWSRMGGPSGRDNTQHSERGGAMIAGTYDLTPKGNRGFQAWCEVWGAECLRILKPGGHLLSFGGTRTYHRLAAGLEDAGFEIRDCLAWMFGSGFPKSLDVAKAIDSRDASKARLERAFRSQAWLREHVTPQAVNEATRTDMGHHLTTHPSQPFVPTPTMLDQLRPILPAIPDWLEDLVRDRAVESENMKAREVIGRARGTTAPGVAGERHRGGVPTEWDETIAFSPEASRWEGWGTALKPAFEPIVLARKPLSGTVAGNVLAYGTGALNIDATRIENEVSDDARRTRRSATALGFMNDDGWEPSEVETGGSLSGRWPANVLLDEDAADVLDGQTGESSSSIGKLRGATAGPGWGMTATGAEYDDVGGASRFFYCAKVSRAERNAGLDGFEETRVVVGDDRPSGSMNERLGKPSEAPGHNVHPTVKPIDLMRWLIRLITPPDGTVLDPFLGSGTTGIAAVLEKRNFIGIEREPDYMKIAEARIAFWDEWGEKALEYVKREEAAEAKRGTIRDAGQLDIFAAFEE